MKSRKALAVRDQAVSAFSGTLMRLCDATAALGAALVDAEGETVDYAGCLEPFEIRVAAAEWRLVLQAAIDGQTQIGAATHLLYRGQHKSYAIFAVSDGYALVIQTAHRSLVPSIHAVAEAVQALCVEAGLQLEDESEFRTEHWHRVEVRLDASRQRPTDLWHGGGWVPLELLGRYSEPTRRGRRTGYRARYLNGSELTLVREPLGAWYADDLPHVTSSAAPTGPAPRQCGSGTG